MEKSKKKENVKYQNFSQIVKNYKSYTIEYMKLFLKSHNFFLFI